jgi:AcrR family transcriptional regulator
MSIVKATAPAQRTRRPATETRQHILDVAEELFYWQGIRATGIDKIVAEAGIAPTTLYRLFGSKDDLVAAYVDRYATGYREWIESITSAPDLSPRDRILALFDALAANTGPDSFRGCPFLMALAEYPDPGSAAHASAQGVKAWVRAKLLHLTGQLPGRTPATRARLADHLALVVEGLYASTAALGTDGPARNARSLAALLIDTPAKSRT